MVLLELVRRLECSFNLFSLLPFFLSWQIYGTKKYILFQNSRIENISRFLFVLQHITGKTTSVHALARELLGKAYKNGVLELNASDERGIDVRGCLVFEVSKSG